MCVRFVLSIVETQIKKPNLPADLLETVSNVVTPNVIRPGTESGSIQKETHEIITINMVGM